MNGEFTTLYRQFGFGDRSRFFFSVEFVPDPEPVGAMIEEHASWGRFQIWAGGRNLCAHYVDGVLYEHITWYLLPVLEWLAAEWDYLLHEQRFPYRNTAGHGGEALRALNSPETFDKPGGWDEAAAEAVHEWACRHSLQMHREGGLFPDVWMRRSGECAEVSWTADAPAGAPDGLQFSNGDGGLTLALEDVARPLHTVLQEASMALRTALPKSGRIRNLVRDVRRLSAKEKRSLRVGILASLGTDPAKWRTQWGELIRALRAKHRQKTDLVKRLFIPSRTNDLYVGGECAGALMFAAVSPTIDTGDALILAEILLLQAGGRRTRDGLREHARSEPVKAGIEPWVQGYALAQEWCETVQLGMDARPVDVEAHLRAKGVEIMEVELRDTAIGGVAIAHGAKRPVVAINTANARNKFPSGRKFTLAHELCHLLYDRNRGVELQIVSGPWAPIEIEKRANAFAAALLMPDALIAWAATEENVNLEDMDRTGLIALAKKMAVSVDALGHHLVNRGWIDEAHRVELMAGADEEP